MSNNALKIYTCESNRPKMFMNSNFPGYLGLLFFIYSCLLIVSFMESSFWLLDFWPLFPSKSLFMP